MPVSAAAAVRAVPAAPAVAAESPPRQMSAPAGCRKISSWFVKVMFDPFRHVGKSWEIHRNFVVLQGSSGSVKHRKPVGGVGCILMHGWQSDLMNRKVTQALCLSLSLSHPLSFRASLRLYLSM